MTTHFTGDTVVQAHFMMHDFTSIIIVFTAQNYFSGVLTLCVHIYVNFAHSKFLLNCAIL